MERSIQNHTAHTLIVINCCCHDRSISEPATIKIIWLRAQARNDCWRVSFGPRATFCRPLVYWFTFDEKQTSTKPTVTPAPSVHWNNFVIYQLVINRALTLKALEASNHLYLGLSIRWLPGIMLMLPMATHWEDRPFVPALTIGWQNDAKWTHHPIRAHR